MCRPSLLHDEIVRFAAKMTPRPEEHERCEKVIEILRKITYDAFGREVEVSPFGSYANGLAARHSDLDLVITGLLKPDTPEGFFGYKQVLVWQHLEMLQKQILNCSALNVQDVQFIRHAKVPILKVVLKDQIMLDISINDETSTRAASFVLEKVRQYPSLRPLCLVLKAFLKKYKLSAVKDGGLGGYALTNIVIAHLQETTKAGKPMHDFGELLIAFFLRFGRQFDPESQAVSVRKGGLVPKSWVKADSYRCHSGRSIGSALRSTAARWFIENPVTGRDVAQGSYKIYVVREVFHSAHVTLKSLRKGDGHDCPLSALFDVHRHIE